MRAKPKAGNGAAKGAGKPQGAASAPPKAEAPKAPRPEPIAQQRPVAGQGAGLTAADLIDALEQETVTLLVRCSTVQVTLAVVRAAGAENVSVAKG